MGYVYDKVDSAYYYQKFVTTRYDFPVTNHVQCVEKENVGWIRGIMDDGIPFEAEMWQSGEDCSISFMVPIIINDGHFNPFDTLKRQQLYKDLKDSNTELFQYECKSYDGGVLPIGMVDGGYENDLLVTQNYVELLQRNSLIELTTDMYNGTVQYVTDIAGNEFARIIITLEDEDDEWAVSPLQFEEFPTNKKKHKFKVVQ